MERKIDDFVFNLYGLTATERALVLSARSENTHPLEAPQ